MYRSLYRTGILLLVIVVTLIISLPAREPHRYTLEAYKLETSYSDKVFLDSDKYMITILLIDATVPTPINISFSLLTWEQFSYALRGSSYEVHTQKIFIFNQIGDSKRFNITLTPHKVYVITLDSPNISNIHILVKIIPLGSEVITWKMAGLFTYIAIALIIPYCAKEIHRIINSRNK